MTRSIPMIQARKKLTHLPEEFQRKPRMNTGAVKRRGKPVLAVLPWEFYESLVETLEILSDKKLLSGLKASIREIRAGKLIPWKGSKRKWECEVSKRKSDRFVVAIGLRKEGDKEDIYKLAKKLI